MGKLNRFIKRRWIGVMIFLWLSFALILADKVVGNLVRETVYQSGWALFVLICFLTAYNLRKKLSMIPLGKSNLWLQVHIYAGLFSLPMFLVHIRWRVPNGVFESFLTATMLIVFCSGLFGLVISRIFAQRLTTRGPEEVFERIPRRRNLVLADSERLVLGCLERTKSTAVPEFYAERLEHFLAKPRNMLWHLMLSTRPRQQVLMDLEAHKRYLNDDERETMNDLARNVEYKDDLDFQYAHMAMLKYWLYLHVPFAYSLLIFCLTHVALVHLFSGDLR